MPLFDWRADSYRRVPTARFWIYWVVTVPLTFIVILIWLWWKRRTDRKIRGESNGPSSYSDPESTRIENE